MRLCQVNDGINSKGNDKRSCHMNVTY
uniref:Uncharacterized protein n=1 Tax=Lepeophtheirus salmonis TaxID=72036 RepID=A0A0K2THU2_LEPSM